MRRILKRFTGLFCVLALCLSMLPVSALAAEGRALESINHSPLG